MNLTFKQFLELLSFNNIDPIYVDIYLFTDGDHGLKYFAGALVYEDHEATSIDGDDYNLNLKDQILDYDVDKYIETTYRDRQVRSVSVTLKGF